MYHSHQLYCQVFRRHILLSDWSNRDTQSTTSISLAVLLLALISPMQFSAFATADEPPLRDLNSHCPFVPPESIEAWQNRATDLQQQLEVSLGLLPRLDLDPVVPSIYGKINMDGYSVEKLIFESLPGYFVTGNLYRPLEIPRGTKVPGILCPHGHWREARFYDAGDEAVRQLLAGGAERFENAARNHIQARCVQLARMGCIVFHWDMVGYCDNTQISFERAHRFAEQSKASERTDAGWLLFSPLSESHFQSVMGLQALATTRAVDMLLSLSDVDPDRIAISGASGGGTQSFIGAAVDPRIRVAFPAVMVSTGMQGGCTCENACMLRTGTGNVEMAALIAPRPLGLTAADDWTKTMPGDGYPELAKLYSLYDAEDNVALFPAIHFGHNFNHVSRVHLYGWINQHFDLGHETPILERDFKLLRKEKLSVWDSQHPEPKGGDEFERDLMAMWADIVDAQLTALRQGDRYQVEELMQILNSGWRVSLGLTSSRSHEPAHLIEQTGSAMKLATDELGTWELVARSDKNKADNSAFGVTPYDPGNHETLYESWVPSPDDLRVDLVSADGSRKTLYPQLKGVKTREDQLLKVAHQALVSNPRLAAAYSFGYNLPLFAIRAQQLGQTIHWLQKQHPDHQLVLHGSGADAALAAAGLFCAQQSVEQESKPAKGESISLRLEINDFTFADVADIRDPNFLPGASKYWELPGLLSCLRGINAEIGTSNHKRYEQLKGIYKLGQNTVGFHSL